MKKVKSAKQKMPPGWTEQGIRKLAKYYDNLTEEQQAAAMESALRKNGQTLMVVPTKLVPQIRKLIARKRTA